MQASKVLSAQRDIADIVGRDIQDVVRSRTAPRGCRGVQELAVQPVDQASRIVLCFDPLELSGAVPKVRFPWVAAFWDALDVPVVLGPL